MGKIHRFCFSALCYFVRLILRLRYSIEIRGLKEVLLLRGNRAGVLFMPNHPAEIDPIILMAIIGPHFFPRSMIVEHFYRLKGFQKILDYGRVLPIPSMEDKANKWKKRELEKTYAFVKDELKNGENFIIYPSGKLKRSGYEKIGGASIVHSLLQSSEEISAVLVRSTGLWGSSFSVGKTGHTPDFGKTLLKGAWTLIKNGIFFAPRRKVLFEFAVPKNLPRMGDRLEFNRYLENWYNRHPEEGPEPLSLIQDTWFSKVSLPEIKEEKQIEGKRVVSAVDPKIEKEVCGYLAELAKMPEENIERHLNLSFDLGLDSLDIAEIHAFLDKKYDAGGIDLGDLQSVEDIFVAIVEKRQRRNEKVETAIDLHKWFEKDKRPPFFMPEGNTLAEVFLYSCALRKGAVACADDKSGVLSYKKIKLAALLLAEEFRKIEGERVGVLMPALSTTYITVFALLLAGKVPVMLNWTVGKNVLNHSVDKTGVSLVITSKRFLDKIHLEDLGKIEDSFLFLEDIKDRIGFKEKIQALWRSFWSIRKLQSYFDFTLDGNRTAIILFTSGSEAMPKAVPLSHQHLLENQRGVIELSGMRGDDWLYGVLPPFHSFGLSLTGLLPILAGLKVFYAPDPTDNYKMAEDIDKMQLRTVCLAPSFMKGLFAVAQISQLQSVRLVVSGAEKPPAEVLLFVQEKLPHAEWVEGYGITECSPAVTLHRRGKNDKGVGLPLPGVSLCVIDPSTLEVKKNPEQGEICIDGPSVFDGYLGAQSDPFIMIEGKKWYRSGDFGFIDLDGYLHLTDRLKRTVKIGGEMISLHSVEYALDSLAKEKKWSQEAKTGPTFAVIAQQADKTELVLFTTIKIDLNEINQSLRESGMGRLIKISRLVHVEEIPLTGTGKLHYRRLEEELKGQYV